MRTIALLCVLLGGLAQGFAGGPKPLTVTAGEEFKITLQYNATTGYQWQFPKPPDQKLLKLIDTQFKVANPKLIGSGGDQVWTFKALAEGQTRIDFGYVRPWEQGSKPAQTTNFVIVIKPAKDKTKP